MLRYIVDCETNGLVHQLDTADKKNIDNALCLQSLTSIKTIYDKFRDKKLVDELDIVDIQELYR